MIKMGLQALRRFFCWGFDVFTLSLCKKQNIMEDDNQQKRDTLDFGPVEDTTKEIIKVVGVGGGGCNAVNNMFNEGIANVSFAVCNTDSQSLANSPVPVKLLLGESGLGAGADPELGKQEAIKTKERVKQLFNDSTRMCFITAGMGGGTGTGAAPIIASVAKSMGILTIGIVTIPFYFEKNLKIMKALKGVEEMRKNVDSLLIINNESICDVYADSELSIKDAFKAADNILCNAAKSISELITIEGSINLDFRDVETTMREGGGAIMAIGRARGERRVEKAIVNALESPLLYGSDISNAKKILFNIYTSEDKPLFVSEMREVDAFMYGLNPNIEVIWGTSDDNTLGEDAKVIILATGIDNRFLSDDKHGDSDEEYYNQIIAKLYREPLLSQNAAAKKKAEKKTEDAANTPEPEKHTVEQEHEGTSTSFSFDMSGKGAETKEIKKEPASETDDQKVPLMKPEAKTESPKPTNDSSHKVPSFLDKLKGHLKKGLTVLTSDVDE